METKDMGIDKKPEHFNADNAIKILNGLSEEDKEKKAVSNKEIKEEIKKLCNDIKVMLYHQNREDALKYSLWQGLLNQYGIFGTKRNQHRKSLYTENYKHGDLVSIDFGTSNIGSEFSYTHTAIVLKNYTDYIVVIPITSCKDGRLEHKPLDEQEDTLVLTSTDFKDLDSESYIMLYQIRSVSKNRLQKRIGSIENTDLMNKIDYKLAEIFAENEYKDFLEIKEALKNISETSTRLNEEYEKLGRTVQELENTLKNINKNGVLDKNST